MDPAIFLSVVGCIAIVIVTCTVVAVVIILRQPSPPQQAGASSSGGMIGASEVGAFDTDGFSGDEPGADDVGVGDFLAEQMEKLAEFDLSDISTNFKGTTNDGAREGAVMHLTQNDVPLIVFSAQAESDNSGAIAAETAYGSMELTIANGEANIVWNGEILSVIDYPSQRISGPEGQLLGSIERAAGYTTVSFYGQKAADINTNVHALSTLRWLGGDEAAPEPAFKNLMSELEDIQTLQLLGALLLEIGFYDII